MRVKTVDYGNTIDVILKRLFSLPIMLDSDVVTADSDGLKIVKAGTPIGASVAQVETATIPAAALVGNAGAGNYDVVVTSALVTGSPLTVAVAVANDDDNAAIAGKIQVALAAVTAIAAHYTVGGAASTLILTALVAAADDATLNVELFASTSTATVTSGGTLANVATSANTTTTTVAAAVLKDNRTVKGMVQNNAAAQGILISDIDVTDGDREAAILLNGTVSLTKIESSTGLTIAATAKTALTDVTFVTE